MEINLVFLTQDQNGFYEYDFYPDRKFDGVSHILLYRKESFGNMEYYWYFHDCDQKNIQVIAYTPVNFFPLASLCSHKCRMTQTTPTCYELNYGNTFFNYPHRLAFNAFNVPKWDISNPLRQLFCYKSWQAGDAAEYCFRRPLHMEVCAFEKFQKAKEMYKEGMVCVENKYGPRDPIAASLKVFGSHVVGNDYLFQREVIEKYQAKDCYFSFQILASLFCKCAFVGISGAGSLFTMALPINAIFVLDNELNVPEAHRLYKSRINKRLFNVPTQSFPYYIAGYGFGDWRTGWRWAAIEEAFASVSSITLPEVQINFPKEVKNDC